MRKDDAHACSCKNKIRNIVPPPLGKDLGCLGQVDFPPDEAHCGHQGLSAYVCKLTSKYLCLCKMALLHTLPPPALGTTYPPLPPLCPLPHGKFWKFPGGWVAPSGTLMAAASSMNQSGSPGLTPEGPCLRSYLKEKFVSTSGRGSLVV